MDGATLEEMARGLLVAAYPATGERLRGEDDAYVQDLDRARTLGDFRRLLLEALHGAVVEADIFRVLREVAATQRTRIALREVLLTGAGGAGIATTARELSHLAQALVEAALNAGTVRVGTSPVGARFVVFGMGKLGGEELNAGSDIDLIYVFDGGDEHDDAPAAAYFAVLSKWLTRALDEVTEHGRVWTVDLRLRPMGARGPIAISWNALERYYETMGRLWERVALLRARPIAGDLEFGHDVLSSLRGFVWRRAVDPSIAAEMWRLVERGRQETGSSPRDLKLGRGGIRETEFFVQALQLIWGGQHPELRCPGTWEAIRRLRLLGLVTPNEERQVVNAYALFRKVEHAVQWSTLEATHALPTEPDALVRIATLMGFDGAMSLEAAIEERRTEIAMLFDGLLPGRVVESPWEGVWTALDTSEGAAVGSALARMYALDTEHALEVGEALQVLSVEGGVLSSLMRERFPALAEAATGALAMSTDPRLAARTLGAFFSGSGPASVYARALEEEPRQIRLFVTAIGGSRYLADTIQAHSDVGELLLFQREKFTATGIVEGLRSRMASLKDEPCDDEAFVERIRPELLRETAKIAYADLNEDFGTRDALLALSGIADVTIEMACDHVLGRSERRELAVVALGSLGGRDTGYGSDLDLIFLYDGERDDDAEHYGRAARRIVRLLSMPDASGPGYEVDTRLRPSGAQGLLVTSLRGFKAYHDAADGPRAGAWERLALVKARVVVAPSGLRTTVEHALESAAYDARASTPESRSEIARLRRRLLVELSGEREGRFNPKLGRGGILDIEFAVQLLQQRFGHSDSTVRTTDTLLAIDALTAAGGLAKADANRLRAGYEFLRRLEQRIRMLHVDRSALIERGAPGLPLTARSLGFRDPRPEEGLLEQYAEVTSAVTAIFATTVGTAEGGAP